ncbi:hypothetical protein [Sphingobium yanoikuyae]|uniref:hypothetical protein n=1 Tax=Sphingobium yanoikuyae TaxID=13690 RepID=UPI0028AFCA93|nr:hypothetical protein [Sphingobium yanoikuyae]
MSEASEHTLFVLNEYRREVASNPSVLANNDGAGEISIDTSLNETAASALAGKILAENAHPRIHSASVEGLLWIDWFVGGPPQWQVVFDHDAVDEPMKGISASCNFNEGTTEIEVRG